MRIGVQLIAHADLFLDAESVFPGGPTEVRIGRRINRPSYENADVAVARVPRRPGQR